MLEEINKRLSNTLIDNLGIEIIGVETGKVTATMPIDQRTRQPYGKLHGGASLALAETLAGVGSKFLLEDNQIAVGIQVSGNHVKSADEGQMVFATATCLHLGRTTHVWNVDITSHDKQLISTVRVTNSILTIN